MPPQMKQNKKPQTPNQNKTKKPLTVFIRAYFPFHQYDSLKPTLKWDRNSEFCVNIIKLI